jgi:hypothetical protein
MLEWLEHSSYAQWVDESWGWPLALTIHAFGTATVLGLIFIIGLRLLGFFRTIPYTVVYRLIPFIWIAIVAQAVSGFTLWTTKPGRYLADGMFEVKFSLVIVGIVVTLIFHRVMRREIAGWEAERSVSSLGVKFGVLTCLVWAAVVIGGRLTAYLGQLYLQ